VKIVLQDDHLPMEVEKSSEVEALLDIVWVSSEAKEDILQCVDGPLPSPYR
jgi:hypothetical protein